MESLVKGASISLDLSAQVQDSPVDCAVAGNYEFVGLHLLASYEDCCLESLLDTEQLVKAMQKGVELSGASLISKSCHTFAGGGFTGLFLLAESHASIHTYPEHKSCFLDIFTCGISCRPEELDNLMRVYLQAGKSESKIVLRGNSGLTL